MWLNITSSLDKKCWSRWIQPVTSSSMVQSWSVVTSAVKVKVNRWIRCDVTLMMSLMCLRDTKRHEQECSRQNPKLFCCFSISISSQISFFNFWIGQCFGLLIGQLSFLEIHQKMHCFVKVSQCWLLWCSLVATTITFHWAYCNAMSQNDDSADASNLVTIALTFILHHGHQHKRIFPKIDTENWGGVGTGV